MEVSFTEVPIEEYEEKTGLYLAQGRGITNIKKNISYSIISFNLDSLELKEQTFFEKEQGSILEITYKELLAGYTKGILSIEGFDKGQLKDLQSAISSLQKKIELIIKQRTFEEVTTQLETIKVQSKERNKQDEDRIKQLIEQKEALETALKYVNK